MKMFIIGAKKQSDRNRKRNNYTVWLKYEEISQSAITQRKLNMPVFIYIISICISIRFEMKK